MITGNGMRQHVFNISIQGDALIGGSFNKFSVQIGINMALDIPARNSYLALQKSSF